MKLIARLVEVAYLSSNDRSRMLALMERHYECVAPAAFQADLDEKRWVIQVAHAGELCGFSTQMILETNVDGRPVRALFSGDTIVDRQHWGDTALMAAVGRLALSLIDELPGELYWFLISQGYKTYRYLPLFFKEFYPCYDAPAPQHVGQVIEALARAKFGSSFDATTGIIRSPTYHLREGIADVTSERLRDPHVEFFVERNPGHVRGDELCCIAPLTRDNFTAAALRVFR